MGKNKNSKKPNNKKSQQTNEQNTDSSTSTAVSTQQQTEVQTQNQTVEEEPQIQLTAQEKAQKYKEMQFEFYNGCTKGFEDEEIGLRNDVNFIDKENDIEKRKKEEIKKFDKTFKKEEAEVEDLYNDILANHEDQNKLKAFKDRITKTINEIIKNQRQLFKVQAALTESDKSLSKVKLDISTCNSKREMLSKLCLSLLEKNYELYLKHEQQLEQEREERGKLAQNFQDQMKEVTEELEQQKIQRSAEFQENQEIRLKIQNAINDYKKKEEQYRGKMESHGKVITNIEKKLREAIEGSITKTLKSAEKEKAKFMKSCENVKELTDKINAYAEKFDKIKDEMSENGKKFENFQQEIETKNLKIKLLDTEIQNIQLNHTKHQKIEAEVTEDRKRLVQQIEMLRSLKTALTQQQQSLSVEGDKENQINNSK